MPAERSDDFEAWRATARERLIAGIAPDRATWDGEGGDLFAQDASRALGVGAGDRIAAPRAFRDFMQIAQSAFLHTDPERFSILYRLLWRLQERPHLMEDRADPDVKRAGLLAQQVRREIHKMRAFLRFRRVTDPDGSEL